MEYRVDELARGAGIAVDTVRFYQGKGLLPPPRRRGRVAIYDDTHAAALRRIRDLAEQGFKLEQIRRVLEREAGARRPGRRAGAGRRDEELLAALVEESVGTRRYTRAELAREAGVPEVLVDAAVSAGLVEPIALNGEPSFSEADLELTRTGLQILGAGFPLDALLRLAMQHAGHVRDVTEGAIALFDEHVRQRGDAGDEGAVTEAFRELLPRVTRLVALHFQRTLVARALARLRASGESEALEQALAATADASLEVACRWR